MINLSLNDLANSPNGVSAASGRPADVAAFTGLLNQFDRSQQAEAPAKPGRQRTDRAAISQRDDEPTKSSRRAAPRPAPNARDQTTFADAPASRKSAAAETQRSETDSIRQDDDAKTASNENIEIFLAQAPAAVIVAAIQPAAQATLNVVADDPVSGIASDGEAEAGKAQTPAAPLDESPAAAGDRKREALATMARSAETAKAEKTAHATTPAQQKAAAQAAELGKRLDNLPMQVAVQLTTEAASKPLKAPVALANGMSHAAQADTATATQTAAAAPTVDPAAAAAAKAAEASALPSPVAAQNATPAFAAMIDIAADTLLPTATKTGMLEPAAANGVGASSAASANAANGSPAAAKPAPLPHPATEQVIVHIAKASADGIDKINVKLKPAALGSVEVQIDLAADGRVRVAVSADRADTLDLMQRDARALERALADAGLQADRESFSFNLRDQGTPNGSAGSDHAGRKGLQNGPESLDETLPAVGQYLNARAAVGGVDIRV